MVTNTSFMVNTVLYVKKNQDDVYYYTCWTLRVLNDVYNTLRGSVSQFSNPYIDDIYMMYQPDPYHISSNKCKIDRYSQERNSSPCLELTPARFTTMHIFIIPRKIFQYTPRVRIRMDELQFNMLFTIPLIDKILLLLIFQQKVDDF